MERDLIRRPKRLEADVVRFQNEYEKWLAVIGIMDGRPYEIFTGRMEDAFNLPSYVEKGVVIKEKDEDGVSRYDFQYTDKEGYRTTIEGLSRSFNKEYWNYASTDIRYPASRNAFELCSGTDQQPPPVRR